MLVIAHRGASGHAPEHTFAAWDLALGMGADYLEQDLQLTRDGVLVVMHDETLDRTVRGGAGSGRGGIVPRRGRVIDHAWAELDGCDVGSWFNETYPDRARAEYAGQPLPTLDAVFERYADRASFYIETKNPESAPGMEQALLALLDRHGLRTAARRDWRVLIQSFSEASLRLIHALDPELPLIQLLQARRTTSRGIVRRLSRIREHAVGIGPSWRSVDARLAEAARHHCLELHPYTVNDPALMERLAADGVTGMFTDVPDVLLAQRPIDEARGRDATAAAAARQRECRGAVINTEGLQS